MLYITCPTCGYFLGQITIKYEQEKEKICSNPNITPDERDEQLAKLLQTLKLRRYCCKMRVMTYKDLVKDILPVPQEQ